MKSICLFALILCLLLFAGAVSAETTIMVVSDLHYLSPSLYEGSDLFLRSIAKGDGKMTHRSDVLLNAMIAQAERIHPDLLLLTGDLSFNGEKQSHLELAQALEPLLHQGIQVYVIPGNHDINVTSAFAFSGETYRLTDSVTADEFRAIYQDYLGAPGDNRIGISYTVSLKNAIDVCMLDCAFYEPVAYTFGLLDEARAAWFEEEAARAESAGRLFLSATHHSVIPHSSLWKENFVILNAERIVLTLSRHNAHLTLSGHLHIQHIAENNGVYDIASGAFSVFPHHYGLITIADDRQITYQAYSPDTDLLPGQFMEESEAWFRSTNHTKMQSSLEELGTESKAAETMLQYSDDLNVAYFSGTLRQNDTQWKEAEGYHLWMQYSEQMGFAQYLDLVLSEASPDALSLSIP